MRPYPWPGLRSRRPEKPTAMSHRPGTGPSHAHPWRRFGFDGSAAIWMVVASRARVVAGHGCSRNEEARMPIPPEAANRSTTVSGTDKTDFPGRHFGRGAWQARPPPRNSRQKTRKKRREFRVIRAEILTPARIYSADSLTHLTEPIRMCVASVVVGPCPDYLPTNPLLRPSEPIQAGARLRPPRRAAIRPR
jgi:hypothetical protein